MQEPHQMKRLHLLWSSPGCIEADSKNVVMLCYYMPPKHQHHTTINFKYTTMAPNHWGSVQKEEIRSSLGCNKADSSVDIVWILLLSLLYYWNICTIAFTVTKCSGEVCMLLSGTGEGGWFTFTHREKKYGYIWVWMYKGLSWHWNSLGGPFLSLWE